MVGGHRFSCLVLSASSGRSHGIAGIEIHQQKNLTCRNPRSKRAALRRSRTITRCHGELSCAALMCAPFCLLGSAMCSHFIFLFPGYIHSWLREEVSAKQPYCSLSVPVSLALWEMLLVGL